MTAPKPLYLLGAKAAGISTTDSVTQ